jgi:hypothetical protein
VAGGGGQYVTFPEKSSRSGGTDSGGCSRFGLLGNVHKVSAMQGPTNVLFRNSISTSLTTGSQRVMLSTPPILTQFSIARRLPDRMSTHADSIAPLTTNSQFRTIQTGTPVLIMLATFVFSMTSRQLAT